jgi:hypothetical protein
MAHGHVTVMVTALMAQMKLIVVATAVLMVNLTVAMDLVSMAAGHVTDMVTVLMAQTKLIVVLRLVLTVNMIGQLTDLNVVIQQQQTLALTVLH